MADNTTLSATQSAGETMPPVSVWILPVLAAWVIPGAGHFMLKKPGRGALLFGSVLLMFLFGLSMSGMMFAPEKGADYLTSLINYGGFACDLAAGGMYVLAMMFGYAQPDMPGAVHDYGTKFLVTAGLLNILAIADAYEIATGKKD
jgi:TM2 domain-containing membrane protein YozV